MTLFSIRTYAMTVAYWCARALQLQLFLTLFSVPILVSWGLPISYMSPLGNCLFAPFLTIFLLLASLMFFGQLLQLPYGFFAWLLNGVTDYWIAVMQYGSMRWLVGIAQLPMPVLVVIGMAPFGIIAYRPTRSLLRSTICFSVIFMCLYGYARVTTTQTQITRVPCRHGQLTLVTTPHATVLIDPGHLGSMISASSWVRYMLVPTIIKETGTTHIHHLIMLQPMGLGFEAIEQLCTLLRVDTIYIPLWRGTFQRSHLRRFAHLQKTAAAAGTNIVRIDSIQRQVLEAESAVVSIIPQNTQICMKDITCQVQTVQVQIDNKEVTIYPAKYVIPEKKSHHKRKFQQKE